jgi:hypothetical protein
MNNLQDAIVAIETYGLRDGVTIGSAGDPAQIVLSGDLPGTQGNLISHSPYIDNPVTNDQVGIYSLTYGAVSDFASPHIISGLSGQTSPQFTFTTPKSGDVVGSEQNVLLQGMAAGGNFTGSLRGMYSHVDMSGDGNSATIDVVYGLRSDVGLSSSGANYIVTDAISGYFGDPEPTNIGTLTRKYSVFAVGDVGIGGTLAAPKTKFPLAGGIQTQPAAGTAVFPLDIGALGSDITLGDDVTSTPGGAVSNFAGMVIVNNTISGQVGLFLTGGNALVLVAQTSTEYDDADTDGSSCLYLAATIVTLKNRLGSQQTYRVMMLRTRNTN